MTSFKWRRGILTARNSGLALLTSFSVFEPATVRSEADLGPGSFRVVPGFVLAVGQQLISRPGDECSAATAPRFA